MWHMRLQYNLLCFAGEKIGMEYLYSQTGQVMQDVFSNPDCMESAQYEMDGDSDQTDDEDEGFEEEVDDPTLPPVDASSEDQVAPEIIPDMTSDTPKATPISQPVTTPTPETSESPSVVDQPASIEDPSVSLNISGIFKFVTNVLCFSMGQL
jgi:hypothetical protein